MTGRGPFGLVADLSGDPGPWLLRVLLAANAGRIAALVPSEHPDVRSQTAQQALADLIGPKYTLRFLRSQPDNWHTIAVADAVDATALEPPGRLVRRLLHPAPGQGGHPWRGGLRTAPPGPRRQPAPHQTAPAP